MAARWRRDGGAMAARLLLLGLLAVGDVALLELRLPLLKLREHPRDHHLERQPHPRRVVLGHHVVFSRLRQLLLRRAHALLDGVLRGAADALAEGHALLVLQPLVRRLHDLERRLRARGAAWA